MPGLLLQLLSQARMQLTCVTLGIAGCFPANFITDSISFVTNFFDGCLLLVCDIMMVQL